MALVEDLLTMVSLCAFLIAFASLGSLLLRLLNILLDTDGQHLLVSIGVGVLVLEIAIFFAQVSPSIPVACVALVAFLGVPLFLESRAVVRRARGLLRSASDLSISSRFIIYLLVCTLVVEFLTSLAPLTGSDAQHYHFAVPNLILQQGFHPLFSISHSFLCGQHHLLIFLGLALGSEKLALGFIFLGGVLSAAVLANFASRWASNQTVLLVTLVFLLTPVVFWQLSASGSPDIYIAFFVGLTLLVINQSRASSSWRYALLAGFLTGGIAGAKYTGCIIAASLAFAYVLEFRKLTSGITFCVGSVASGIWPYFRNFMWTHDPVFPFLGHQLSPNLVTNYALLNLVSDTGVATPRHPSQLFQFLLFAAVRPSGSGFWDFFGPTVLAVAPLVLFAIRNTREWRTAILVWSISSLGIFFTSGLPRFLLPLFPVALTCVAAGIEICSQRDWNILNFVSVAVIASMICLGFGGLLTYSKQPILAAVGIIPRGAYLEDRSQEFQVIEVINRELGALKPPNKALLFLRHLYYVQVPYLNGDPGTSFEVDPEGLQNTDQWREFLKVHHISYVVREAAYPKVLAPLQELERRGDLLPFFQQDVQTFQGMRIDKMRVTVPMTILKTGF